ncbi:MAG: hypothetical protein ACNYPE_11550 [Candidatus Azotimanducaceae bacterium WSBS_2022_MAG_OTU7]
MAVSVCVKKIGDFDTLSPHGQALCRYIVMDPGENIVAGYRDNLGKPPYLMRRENQELTS